MGKIRKIVEIDKKMGIFSGDFCIQECSELIKEIIDYKRTGERNKDKIFKESVDVIFTTIVLLESVGMLDIIEILKKINEIIDEQIQEEIGEKHVDT